MTTWVFLRHAESVANVGGWLSGWEDVPLTELGRGQARRAGELLTQWDLGRCLVSDLGRARETASLALEGRSVATHVQAELRERHMGALNRVSIADARADGRIDRWILPWGAAPPGGETHGAVIARALACLRAWDDGTPTLVVAHGSWIRNVVATIDRVPVDELGRMRSAPNAEPIERCVIDLGALG